MHSETHLTSQNLLYNQFLGVLSYWSPSTGLWHHKTSRGDDFYVVFPNFILCFRLDFCVSEPQFVFPSQNANFQCFVIFCGTQGCGQGSCSVPGGGWSTVGVEKVLLESQNLAVKTDPVCDSEKEFCVSEDQILMAQKIQISNVL